MQEKTGKRFRHDFEDSSFWGVLKKQRGFIFIFCLSSILVSVLLTYVTSEKYKSSTNIFYRPQETTVLRLRVSESFGSPVPNPPYKIINQTIQDIVTSDVILRPVVIKLNLHKKDVPSGNIWWRSFYHRVKEWVTETGADCLSILKYGRIVEEDPVDKAVSRLKKDVSVSSKRDSYILTLTAKDKNPMRVAVIVDEIGENLVAWLKKQNTVLNEHKLVQLRTQLDDKRQELSALWADRTRLLSDKNLASLPQETEKLVKNLYDMDMDNARLKAMIQEKQRKLNELDEQLNTTKRYLNPDDQKRATSERLFESVELKALLAKQSSLNGSAASVRSRLEGIPDLQKQVEQIDMLIASGVREFQQITDLYTESVQHAVTSQGEIRVLHEAYVPSSPVQPIKIYHVGLAAFLSLIVSTGLVSLLAFLNVRVFFASKGVRGRHKENETMVENRNAEVRPDVG